MKQDSAASSLAKRVTDARALAKAQPTLTSLRIAEPGEVLASNPATEQSADKHRASFGRFFMSQGWDSSKLAVKSDKNYTLSLAHIPFALPEPCVGEESRQWGFALTIRDDTSGESLEVFRDRSIPASRSCPQGYDIADVFVYRMQWEKERHVALIGMYTPGFEGFNRRLIAVPFALP